MKIKLLTSALFFFLSAQMQGQEEAPMVAQDNSYTQLLMKRYSGRLYDPKRPVTQEQLQLIMNAGQMAPSSYNEQPWRFIICDKTTDAKAYDKVFNTLVKFNQDWAKNAPVLVVSVAAKKSTKDGTPNRFAQYDTGAAAFSMMMQASSIGLMAHQMGGFDEAKIAKVFGIPKDFEPMAVMAIGYAAETEQKSPAKDRKPINENFYLGKWNP